eukprot:COSAG05_NODE_54_length_23549_cov_81.790840_1_plen_159_part_00
MRIWSSTCYCCSTALRPPQHCWSENRLLMRWRPSNAGRRLVGTAAALKVTVSCGRAGAPMFQWDGHGSSHGRRRELLHCLPKLCASPMPSNGRPRHTLRSARAGLDSIDGCTRDPRSGCTGTLTVKLTGVCIIIFCYTGQSVTSQLRQARPRGPSSLY